MTWTLREVVLEVGVDDEDLAFWIAERWVLPTHEEDDWIFDAADIARIRLIQELKRDLGINDDAMPVVLRLLDQVHSLRNKVTRWEEVIAELPPDVQRRFED